MGQVTAKRARTCRTTTNQGIRKSKHKNMTDSRDKKKLLVIFIKGFLSFFSIDKNPIRIYEKEFKKRSDKDNMAQDWINVGNDIKRAYEKFRPTEFPSH